MFNVRLFTSRYHMSVKQCQGTDLEKFFQISTITTTLHCQTTAKTSSISCGQWDRLSAKFLALWDSDRPISIDESMVRFKGRSSLKQYNPMQPIKRGYKIWCRADVYEYISKFEVYQGKDTENTDLQKEYGLGGKVIITMSKDWFSLIIFRPSLWWNI